MFDEAAREWAGMSGEEFIRRYEAGGYADTVSLADHHIPTGHLDLVDIVRDLILELGVEPRRSDWRQVLDAATV
jgi:hypothetical protein